MREFTCGAHVSRFQYFAILVLLLVELRVVAVSGKVVAHSWNKRKQK